MFSFGGSNGVSSISTDTCDDNAIGMDVAELLQVVADSRCICHLLARVPEKVWQAF